MKVYNTIYWPKRLWRNKKQLSIRLEKIGCTYSRFMQIMVPSLIHATWYIISNKRKYKDYNWRILLINKRTGEKHVC